MSNPHYDQKTCDVYCENCAPDTAEEQWFDETDYPQNCSVCHCPLDSSLTKYGADYLNGHIREEIRQGVKHYNQVHECYIGTYYAGCAHKQIILDWAKKHEYALSDKSRRCIEWMEKH